MNKQDTERHALALRWSEIGNFKFSDLNAKEQEALDTLGLIEWRRHALVQHTERTYDQLSDSAKERIDSALASGLS